MGPYATISCLEMFPARRNESCKLGVILGPSRHRFAAKPRSTLTPEVAASTMARQPLMRLQPQPILPCGRFSCGSLEYWSYSAFHSFRSSARAFFWMVLALGLLGSRPAGAQSPDQIKPTGYVMDSADVLSQSAKDQLTALCTEVDQKAQAQIAVVTIKSLDGRPIEDYSIDLATRLGIGPKKSDRGVMILFAIDDHRDRIEVGYGLEPILPDGKVGTFEREIVPYLRASNYDGAILLVTRRVADVIAADRGVKLVGAVPPAPPQNRGGTGPGQIIGLLFAIFIFFLFLRGMGGGGVGRGSRLVDWSADRSEHDAGRRPRRRVRWRLWRWWRRGWRIWRIRWRRIWRWRCERKLVMCGSAGLP